VSGPGCPTAKHTGEGGVVDASLRRSDAPPELDTVRGGAAHHLATGASSGGAFGPYRWVPRPVLGGARFSAGQ
jgi:hypothetical protein